MQVHQACALLGDLTAEQFMARHWQKKPLLVRAAVPGFSPLLSPDQLWELAAREEVESRVVRMSQKGWKLAHGPFQARISSKKSDWTLLVQGVDLYCQPAHQLLQSFRFVPNARLDDLMISLAGSGGGVGPHCDSYDVFLLQAAGRRRWRIGAQKDLTLLDGAPLKILRDFRPTQDLILHPGDMLYLPPRYAHEGVALDSDCQTYSIGFRAPRAGELARDILYRLADDIADQIDHSPQWMRLYTDKAQPAAAHPGLLPDALIEFARSAISRATGDRLLLAQLVGEHLTEPKSAQAFEPGRLPKRFKTIHLARATRISYDAKHLYINGESFRCGGQDARLLRRLADERCLPAADLGTASPALLHALAEFAKEGWVLAC